MGILSKLAEVGTVVAQMAKKYWEISLKA
jgi:hypothetical protein